MTMCNRVLKPLKRVRWVCIAALVLMTLVLPAGTEAMATSSVLPITPTEKANVVIDGKPLFQVESSGDFTARQRAEEANRLLADLAESASQTEVEVAEHNQQPIILANNQYLLTVTALDAQPHVTPVKQAYIWSHQIERSLDSSRLERSPRHTKEMIFLSILLLAVALAIHIVAGYIWRPLPHYADETAVPSFSKASSSTSHSLNLTTNLKLWLARLSVWAIALNHILTLFPNLRRQRYTLLNNFANSIRSPVFSVGRQTYTLIDILLLLGFIVGLFVLVRLSTRFLATNILGRTPLERGSREVITQSFRYGAFSLGMLILLRLWGIDLRSVALLGSALGIGIGFGLQDIAKNFGSGLVLLFERSIQVGDYIEIDTHAGIVERIGARSITIRTVDHVSVLVPNAHLLDSQVINWNHDHPTSRFHITIGTSYAADSQLVKSILLQAAQENEEVLATPAPAVFLKNFGDSAIEFDLMVWIRNPERQAPIRSALNFRIEEILNDHNISIPFPQRDVNLNLEDPIPVEFSSEIKDALLEVFGNAKRTPEIPLSRIKASVRSVQ